MFSKPVTSRAWSERLTTVPPSRQSINLFVVAIFVVLVLNLFLVGHRVNSLSSKARHRPLARSVSIAVKLPPVQ